MHRYNGFEAWREGHNEPPQEAEVWRLVRRLSAARGTPGPNHRGASSLRSFRTCRPVAGPENYNTKEIQE